MESKDRPQTLPTLFAHAVACHGKRDAIVTDQVRMTFEDLDAARRASARAFLAAGLRKGDRIAVWAPNIPEHVIAAAGCQSVGGVLVPINTRYKAAEAVDVLQRSRARWLVTVPEFLGVRYPELLRGAHLPDLQAVIQIGGPQGEGSSWNEFLGGGARVADDDLLTRMLDIREHDLLDLMFTSGTTGKAKAAMSTHGKTLRAYWSFTAHTTINERDRYLIINPFFHSFGYKYGWLTCVMRGACMLPVQVFDVERTLETIQRQRVTVMPGPPTVYQMLLAHPHRTDFDLSSLRFGQTGAAMIPVELIRSMYRDLKLQFVLTGYGLTESAGLATTTDLDDDPETIVSTVGRPIEGVELRVVDKHGRALPVGEPGEILLRGDNVMTGYLDDPESTAAAIDREGFLHTGDVGVLDVNGRLRITDRIKDMIIVGGFNCYPAEVENELCSAPGVLQAAVIGVPDERLGEVPKAYVVLKPAARVSSLELIEWCRERLANFKVPRSVEFVERLPTNASGKVMKTELRAARG
jgi:acyl-CoA synthetase (AMP-forming)/AMP-acid ligase II